MVVWDLTKGIEQQDRRDRREVDEDAPKEDKDKKKVVDAPVILFSLLSTMSTSHTGIVSDIHWLPKDFQVQATCNLLFAFHLGS